MAGAHRIGILTSGGDAPGMNPAIRAIVRTAGAEGITCIGIRRGYAGLINGDVFELTGNDVDGIARRGGTILYTARSEEFRTPAPHVHPLGLLACRDDACDRDAELLCGAVLVDQLHGGLLDQRTAVCRAGAEHPDNVRTL